jgi:small-conductance mechanosensitive channel
MLPKRGGMSSEREAGACVETATCATIKPVREYLTEKLPGQAAEWLPRIGSALLVLFVFWMLAVVARKVVRKAGVAAGIDSSVISLLSRSAHIVLMVVGLVTALGTLGIDVSAIVASLGLTGFAVGFALKDSISNLLSGVLILIHRPFNVGDTIRVKTFEGLVSAIDLRYTRLEQDGEKILVPNSLLFTNPISILPESSREN